jgi:ferredoxin-NADP reductase
MTTVTATPDAEAPEPTANFSNIIDQTFADAARNAEIVALAREVNRLKQQQNARFDLIQVAEDAYQEARRLANQAEDRLREALWGIQ